MTIVIDAICTRLEDAPIVPLIQATDAEIARHTADALVAGGLSVIEVVMRTEEALSCLNHVVERVPEAIVGAGTVLSENHAEAAIDAGAAFVVSPGLDAQVVATCRNAGIPVFPGVATASELQRAWNLGINVVKFFPASLNGGVAMLRALGAVFRDVQFMPTGGISAQNLAEYTAQRNVLACGGSWLTPAAAIDTGDFDAIRNLACEAITLARNSRKD